MTIEQQLQERSGGRYELCGTMVRNISLTSNPEHIEGKVKGTQMVQVAKFLKKA